MNETILSVSELNVYVKRLLASDKILQGIAIEGEISNLKTHYSGHWYFTLKDADSSIACVMFRVDNISVAFIPKDGMKVKLYGNVSLYEKTGQYQFYARVMANSGIGDIYRNFEALKYKLQNMGYFDQEHKKQLPLYPNAVGVITSKSGSVIHDILNVAKNRNSNIKFILYPALVQGEGSAQKVINGIHYFNQKKNVDVIIIARGGGSFEDLNEFNNEELALEIFKSNIPIVSAIGHETDFTIADFISDKRASTPSQAAEIVVVDNRFLKQSITEMYNKAFSIYYYKIIKLQKSIDSIYNTLLLNSPKNKILLNEVKLNNYFKNLQKNFQVKMFKLTNTLDKYSLQLKLLNVDNILEKGFALVKNENGNIISSINNMQDKGSLYIKFKDGTVKINYQRSNNEINDI